MMKKAVLDGIKRIGGRGNCGITKFSKLTKFRQEVHEGHEGMKEGSFGWD
jgi:hypothetical protein